MHRDSDAKRNERCKGLANILIRYLWLFVSLVVLISGVLATFLPSLRMEASLKSAFVTSSPAYMEYVRFLEAFGD